MPRYKARYEHDCSSMPRHRSASWSPRPKAPSRRAKLLRSVSSSTIGRFPIPRTITWCRVPGLSSLACLGIPFYPQIPSPVFQFVQLVNSVPRMHAFRMAAHVFSTLVCLGAWISCTVGLHAFFRNVSERAGGLFLGAAILSWLALGAVFVVSFIVEDYRRKKPTDYGDPAEYNEEKK